jgi:acyl-CoA synthetase (AMP-forming)/AMP-acid ligase II
MLTHRNVCTHARWAVRELGLTDRDRWGHFAPMFHLADAWATFAVTAVGGVHVMEPRFTAEAALEAIERERVTLTNLVPTMLTAMVASPRSAGFDPSSLRMVLSGGAPITPALVRRIVEVFRCEYVQTYGMTETSPYLTVSLLGEHLRGLPEAERLRFAARTGRPFGEIELEVVDGSGARVPADDRTVGEIRVRGATVSPGYWQRPEETAAAHRGGWLYTGDLAVVDGEGYVDIVDRKKDMIITGGEKVYSIEVESVLADHPAVLAAAVYGLPDPTWGEMVSAAVVLAEGERASGEELMDWCRARIAAFKAPRRIDFVRELPKTGSGKVSKRALRERALGG